MVNGEKYPCDQYKMYQWGALKYSSFCSKLNKSRNLSLKTFSQALGLILWCRIMRFLSLYPDLFWLSKTLQLSALDFALGLILSSALPIPFTFYFDDLKCFNFQRRTSRWDWSCDAAEREEEEQGGCHQGNWPRTKGEYIFNSFLQSVFIKSPWWVFWIVSGRFFCFYCFYMILMRQGCVYNWNR